MNVRVRTWGLVIAALPISPLLAEPADGLDLSGSTRLRYEAIANQPRVGFRRNDDFASLRTTLLAAFRSGAFSAAVELWDSRIYGERSGSAVTTGEVNTIEPVQAYVGWKGAIGGTRLSAQAGRFTLNLGSRRLIAADDYRNTTNGYTGFRADLAGSHGLTATAIYVLPQQRRPDDVGALRDNEVGFDHEGFDEVLWGATIARPKAWGAVTAEASFYHFGEHDRPGRPTRDRSLDSYDARILRDPAVRKWDGEVEVIYQAGTISASTAANAARQSVSAWFVHASAGYSFPGPLKPRLSLQYDRASGDRPGGHYGHFDTLFGMRRADYAPAGLYNAIGRANMSTPGVRIEIAPSPRWDAFATYHALWLADASDAFSTTGVRDPAGRSGRFAGHQLDARVRWWARPDRLRLEADGVILAKRRFLEEAPNAPAGATTAYVALNLSAFF